MSSGRSRQYVVLPSILHAAKRTSLTLNREEQHPNKPQPSPVTENQCPQAAVLEAQQGPGHSNPGVVEPAPLQPCSGTVRTCSDPRARTEAPWAVISCASFEP